MFIVISCAKDIRPPGGVVNKAPQIFYKYLMPPVSFGID